MGGKRTFAAQIMNGRNAQEVAPGTNWDVALGRGSGHGGATEGDFSLVV